MQNFHILLTMKTGIGDTMRKNTHVNLEGPKVYLPWFACACL